MLCGYPPFGMAAKTDEEINNNVLKGRVRYPMSE